MKTETCKLYSRAFWIFLSNIIKIYPYHFELYRFKVGPFFETQCISSAPTFTTQQPVSSPSPSFTPNLATVTLYTTIFQTLKLHKLVLVLVLIRDFIFEAAFHSILRFCFHALNCAMLITKKTHQIHNDNYIST